MQPSGQDPRAPLDYAPVGRTLLNASRQCGSLEGLVNGQYRLVARKGLPA